jgi:hypothetical protein
VHFVLASSLVSQSHSHMATTGLKAVVVGATGERLRPAHEAHDTRSRLSCQADRPWRDCCRTPCSRHARSRPCANTSALLPLLPLAGAVGEALVHQLLDSPSFARVTTVGRRAVPGVQQV